MKNKGTQLYSRDIGPTKSVPPAELEVMDMDKLLTTMLDTCIANMKAEGVYENLRAEAEQIDRLAKTLQKEITRVINELPDDPALLKDVLQTAIHFPDELPEHPAMKDRLEKVLQPIKDFHPQFSQPDVQIMLEHIRKEKKNSVGKTGCSCESDCSGKSDCSCDHGA